MKKTLSFLLLVSIFLLMPVYCSAFSISKVDKLIQESHLDDNSIVAVSIKKVSDNTPVYEHNSKKLQHPASVLKLFTSYFALNTLGYDYFFKTGFYTDKENNLYIRLGADPLLTTNQIKDAFIKIKEEKGASFNNLYFDDSIIDKREFGPGWMWDDDINPYTPKISAYNLDGNIIKVNMSVNPDGSIKTSTDTTYPMSVFSDIKLNSKINYLEIERYNWNNPELVEITGTVAFPRTISVPVSSMRRYFIHNVEKILEDNRISIKSTLYASKLIPDGAELIYEIKNPITSTIAGILQASNNLMAGSIFKLAGGSAYNATGTADLAVAAMRDFYKKNKIETESIIIRDGCGISRKNLITADWITDALNKMYEEKDFEKFKEYMAQAGDGTLSDRLFDLRGEAWLKTGSLSNVSAIAGYIQSQDGNMYSVAIITQNFKESQKEIKKFEDKIITLIYNR